MDSVKKTDKNLSQYNPLIVYISIYLTSDVLKKSFYSILSKWIFARKIFINLSHKDFRTVDCYSDSVCCKVETGEMKIVTEYYRCRFQESLIKITLIQFILDESLSAFYDE